MTETGTPERWARFLEQHAPGLTWLAATLLEWGELPPLARKSWRVTVHTSRAGEVSGIAALHAESGLLALASLPELPPPFLGEPESVKRLLGAPETLDQVFSAQPMLLLRRLPGFRRQVFLFDDEAPPRHPALVRAGAGAWDELEEFRREAAGSDDPVTPPELAGPVQRGLVWVLANESGKGAGAMFRVEGVARRRVQITDACVAPALRGQGIGAALLRSAANIARTEYTRGAVIAVAVDDVAERTALRAGYTPVGFLDDVRLA